MNGLVTGEAYVEALNAEAADRLTRAAFVELALGLLPARGRVFDFGCGPGVDARTYAEHGHEVFAYDVDTDMCDCFRRTCAAGISAGRIHLVQRSFEAFLATPGADLPRVDLVTANFAPLNLVPEPAPLFRKLHSMLEANGLLLASLLNPLYFGDLRYAWWWRGLPKLVMHGRYSVPGSQAPITRWLTRRLAREAAPCFALESVAVPAAASARYLFLMLRKRGRA
jgi:SAM-dependent methyltransferase